MRFTTPRFGLVLVLLAALMGRALADPGPADHPKRPHRGRHAVTGGAPRLVESAPPVAPRVAPADPPEPAPEPLRELEPEPEPLLEPEPDPAPLLVMAASPAAAEPSRRSGSRGRVISGAAWAGVAITLSLFTAGTVVGVLAQQRSDALSRSTTQLTNGLAPIYDAAQNTAYTDLQSQGQTFNSAAIGCFVAGGVTTLVSGILFWNATRRQGGDKQLTLRPTVSPRGGLVTLTGSF